MAEIESAIHPRLKPPVMARIDTIESDQTHTSKEINLRDRSDSTWLHNHIFWCVHNGAQVVIGATS